ncbi:MAG: methyltransferase domain-containing protein [Ignavibacteriales bacterium]|nr:methyltransferase domain-containing protein [Ignavibacteriales bacterium]
MMKTASIKKDDFKKMILPYEPHDPTPVVEEAVETLFEVLEKEYCEPFEKRLDELGEDVHVEWGDGFRPQQRRFMYLAKIGDLEGKSILDVGCGFADLLDFFKKLGMKIGNYRGLDFSEKMLEVARKRHVEYEFERRNIRLDPMKEESYDYVFGSGIFFLRHPDWKKYVHDVVESMFKTARIGVAVNFLMNNAENCRDLNYPTPEEVRKALKGVTNRLDILEDRSTDDFTVYLFKDARFPSH